MGLEGCLGERIAQIAIEREEVLVRLEEIRSKMKRADAKRSGQEDTPNYKKWSSILRGLEHEHDKHKAMITTLEAETKEKTTRFNQIRDDHEAHQSKLEANFNRIMWLPPEEMAALTPEDMELLQEYERQVEAAAKEPEATQFAEAEVPAAVDEPAESEQRQYVQIIDFKPIESPRRAPIVQPATVAKDDSSVTEESAQPTPVEPVSNASSPSPPSTPHAIPAAQEMETDAKSPRKNVFQSAIEKSQQGAISTLTFEEVAVMMTAYRKLTSQPTESPKTAELEENVAGAMWEVHVQCARICANWADLVRREATTPKN